MLDSKNNKLSSQLQDRINSITSTIDDESKKQAVQEFWTNHAVPYFLKLDDIDSAIKTGKIEPADASNDVLVSTNEVLTEGDKLEEYLRDQSLIKQIKNLFRISGAPYGLQSDFVKHAFEKPGGYAGDYEVLEFIYNNKPTSKGFGYCADETFLADDYAKAVRNRKDLMKKILISYLNDNPQDAEILNIACGASRDLRELFEENDFNLTGKTTFTLIDKSQDALDFSKSILKNHPAAIEYKFENHSVYDYLKEKEKYFEELKGKDMVYSIGLADYIPADSFKELIKFLFSILKPQGKLIIAHKDSKNYHPLTPDWWADWNFYLRNQDEVVALVEQSGIQQYKLSLQQEDDTNIIFFIIIEKL